MKVVIPPGVSDGATMQLQREGNFDSKRCKTIALLHWATSFFVLFDFINHLISLSLDITIFSLFLFFFPILLHYFSCRGITGDLYIIIHIGQKQGITREGINLFSKISVDYTDAILGTTVKVYVLEHLFFPLSISNVGCHLCLNLLYKSICWESCAVSSFMYNP